MSKKKESKCSNNKKVLRSSIARATAVHKAFMRDEPIELQVHLEQLSCESLLFPIFDHEVQS